MSNILVIGNRGICGALIEKLRAKDCRVAVLEGFVDGTEVVKMVEWLGDNMTEDEDIDGVVLGAYYKAQNKLPGMMEAGQMFARNLFLPYMLYRFLAKEQFLSKNCGLLFLLDKNRAALGKKFLFYRLLQDNLILLMGLMNSYQQESHRVNCIEVGEHDDEVVLKNILDILLHDKETTGRLIV